LQNFAIEIFNTNNNTKYKNMKALMLEEFKSDFHIKGIDKPIPGIGEVLVRIKAIGINRLD
jgi:D-arabinose 1-dehydrogenase-like Zn-dependent alcohol dehydrogenase